MPVSMLPDRLLAASAEARHWPIMARFLWSHCGDEERCLELDVWQALSRSVELNAPGIFENGPILNAVADSIVRLGDDGIAFASNAHLACLRIAECILCARGDLDVSDPPEAGWKAPEDCLEFDGMELQMLVDREFGKVLDKYGMPDFSGLSLALGEDYDAEHADLVECLGEYLAEEFSMFDTFSRFFLDVQPDNGKGDAERCSALDARDEWLYGLVMEGVAYQTIALRLKEHVKENGLKWNCIGHKGVRRAALVYAKRKKLDLPPKRKQ